MPVGAMVSSGGAAYLAIKNSNERRWEESVCEAVEIKKSECINEVGLSNIGAFFILAVIWLMVGLFVATFKGKDEGKALVITLLLWPLEIIGMFGD